ncbi:MAG: hypothetical protein KKH52_01440 [Nanoarchaeota archaeon]|nr:hypothetical protein [Nanoarchaeota archaeon]
MVLERLFPKKWTEKKLKYALLIGFVYSSIAILISVLLFGKNSGLISVVLTSLLILPLLEDLLTKEEKKEEKEKRFSFKRLFIDNKKAALTYLFLFFGIFFTYALYVFIFHLLDMNILSTFHGQLLLDFTKGGATFMFKDFGIILANNWWVLLTIFAVSLFIKDGAIFFITWNASSWGVILSYRAITSANYVTGSSIKFFLILLALSAPFLILEALAYVLVAISGNIIPKDVVKKSKYIHKFILYAVIGIVAFVGIHFLIKLLGMSAWLALVLQMVVVFLVLFLLSKSFKQKKYKEVYIYNFYLFLVAVLIFVVGALLEALITQNVGILTKIYSTSLLFTLPI